MDVRMNALCLVMFVLMPRLVSSLLVLLLDWMSCDVTAAAWQGQADRCFYETLLKQKPESHMAQDWCLAHGVCGAAEAEALYKRVCKRKGLQPLAHAPSLSNSPVKKVKRSSLGGKSRPRSSLPKEVDADTGFDASGVFEGVGTTGF
ncbi:unnamed protein product [Ectocarpus sp. 6 AP-2014]